MTPRWLGDACALADAFRRGERSPTAALDASLGAIEASSVNAFSYLDVQGARAAAGAADVSLPFGGVPMGVKELDRVKGWPFTEASLVFKDRTSDIDHTQVSRLRGAGAVLVGLTTASEFGFVGHTSTKLNGTTRNPWDRERTPGGSSGGTAAAVAGGLVPIGTGGDGGGSIRIPSSYCGLFGLKTTYGRIPKGPRTDEVRMGLTFAPHYKARHGADLEKFRTAIVEATADVFEQVDFVLCATNPWEPFVAEGPTPSVCGDVPCSPFNAGALTIPAN